MSLANTLAVCQAAGSLVLLGDPRQLDQPIQGVHPPGADVSALGHLLGESATVDPSRGGFLDQTWRMHPDICAFTTEQFYEGRLRPQPALRRQTVAGPGPLAGHGLRFIPVEHAGNTNASAEESECVAGLIGELLDAGAAWVDKEGIRKPLTLQDVVAPYNAHVAVLRSTLPAAARVGTVDKFQGQEAPIVILLDGDLERRRSAAGDGVPLQPAPPQRRHLARPLRGRDRRQPNSPHPGLPHPGAHAPSQPLLPLPRAGAAGSRTRAPKLTDAPLSDSRNRSRRASRSGGPFEHDGVTGRIHVAPPRPGTSSRRRGRDADAGDRGLPVCRPSLDDRSAHRRARLRLARRPRDLAAVAPGDRAGVRRRAPRRSGGRSVDFFRPACSVSAAGDPTHTAAPTAATEKSLSS